MLQRCWIICHPYMVHVTVSYNMLQRIEDLTMEWPCGRQCPVPNLSQGESALREGEVAGAVLGPKMWGSRGKTHNIAVLREPAKGPRGQGATMGRSLESYKCMQSRSNTLRLTPTKDPDFKELNRSFPGSLQDCTNLKYIGVFWLVVKTWGLSENKSHLLRCCPKRRSRLSRCQTL
jgi:hypothetical protein